MSTRKKNITPRKAGANRNGRTAEGLRKEALLLFNLIHDESVPKDVRHEITEYVDEVISGAPSSDAVNNKPHFLRCFTESAAGGLTYQVAEILKRLKKGETAESIIRAFDRAREEWRAEREAEMLNAPEPKDKTSDEWRYWKLRRMEQAFEGEDSEAYDRAWDEFKALLDGLLADPSFWHVSNAQALLPRLIIARQEIDRMDASEKRSRAGRKEARREKRR